MNHQWNQIRTHLEAYSEALEERANATKEAMNRINHSSTLSEAKEEIKNARILLDSVSKGDLWAE